MLTSLVSNIVENAGFELQNLDAVAVAKGPGSYTGLRIGVSTAKGLCYALDKPLLAVNTLEAMAYQLKDFFDDSYMLCSMIDARRMEVYCALFRPQNDVLIPVGTTEAKIIDENSFQEHLVTNKLVFFGDGAAKCENILNHNQAIFPKINIYPSAKTVGFLASYLLENGQTEDLSSFEPYYLKDFYVPVAKPKVLP